MGGGGGGMMTSMRLRLVFSFSFVGYVVVRCSGGEGGGVMTSMRMRLVFSFCFVDLLLWCGAVVGGDDVHANATCVFFLFC